jgi:hypothetical protein
MRDSGAIFPWILACITGIGFLFFNGDNGVLFFKLPVIMQKIVGGGIAFFVLACILLFVFGNRQEYQKPKATYVKAGEIQVEGDARMLQSQMFRVAGGGNWEHTGYKKWTFKKAMTTDETQFVVDAINKASNL